MDFMRLLIHDLTDKELEKLLPKLDDNIKILPNTKRNPQMYWLFWLLD